MLRQLNRTRVDAWLGEVDRRSVAYVKWVQRELNRLMRAGLMVDGVIGSRTRAVVRAFQQQKGLIADGVVGPNTERALIAAGAGNPPGAGTSPYIPPSTPVPSKPTSNTVTARILNEARKHIGFHEGPNNDNPFSAYFGNPNVLWCVYFVSYVYTKAGFPLNIGSSDAMLSYLQTKGRFLSNTTAPQPADIVIFDWTQGDHDPAEHVGLVEKVYRSSSGQTRVGTIEGNSGNGVNRRDYALGDVRIVGFGRLVG
jgi:hypothetical protein